MDISRKLVWNLYSATVATVSALVAKKAVDAAWSFVTGDEPPDPNDPATPAGEAFAWILAVAVGVGVSQVFANRFAAQRWSAYTGETSPRRSVNLRL